MKIYLLSYCIPTETVWITVVHFIQFSVVSSFRITRKWKVILDKLVEKKLHNNDRHIFSSNFNLNNSLKPILSFDNVNNN